MFGEELKEIERNSLIISASQKIDTAPLQYIHMILNELSMPILLFQMLVKMSYEQLPATKLYVFFIFECPLNEIYFVPNHPPQLNLIV